MRTIILMLAAACALSAAGFCIPQDKHCGHPKDPPPSVVRHVVLHHLK